MSYEKHTWVNNVDAVDEDKMNHIENGIANLDTRMTNAETNIEQVSSKKGKILWTNPSYTTEFPAQKINLDLSKYTCIRIIYTNWAGSWSFIDNGLTPITSNGILGILNVANTNNRRFTASSTGVEFQAPENNGNNRSNVPIHIIGYENW